MKITLPVLFTVAISVMLFGCTKPGATTNHQKTIDSLVKSTDSLINATPATKTGLDNLLLSAYSYLDGVYKGQPGVAWQTGTDNWVTGSIAGGDAHKGSVPTDQPEAAFIQQYKEDGTNGYLDFKWQVNLTALRYTNAVLLVLPTIKDGSLTISQVAEYTAEARFLRGFYEFELAKIWRNVPYIDVTAKYDKGYPDVLNPGTIWDKIEADFTAAKNVLPAIQTPIGRPNKYAAEAFLVKTLLFDHKYTQAKPFLTDLINNGVTSSGAKYALGHYADNFNPSTKYGPEGVFVIQAVVHNGSEGLDGNAGDALNFPTGGPASCCGFFQPSFSFVNAFKTDANTGLPLLDTYNNGDLKNDLGIGYTEPFTPTTVTVDSRLDWSVGRRGIPYLDWGLMPGSNWSRSTGSEGPYVNIKSVYYQAAQATTSDSYEGWAPNQSTSNGYNAIRFADVLLWAAEVEVEVGSLQTAEDYVNKVRARAADKSGWVHLYKDANNPMNGYTTTPAANYKVGLYGAAGGKAAFGFAAGGQAYARKAVYFERMIELGMEGHRFFDLQRWDSRFGGPAGSGYMAGVLNAYIKHEAQVTGYNDALFSGTSFTAGRSELYPIPQSQISSKIVQNQGY
jgi:hypothetical protein